MESQAPFRNVRLPRNHTTTVDHKDGILLITQVLKDILLLMTEVCNGTVNYLCLKAPEGARLPMTQVCKEFKLPMAIIRAQVKIRNYSL